MPKYSYPTLNVSMNNFKTFENPLVMVSFFEKLIEAFQCMHDAGYVHADIKPQNIFLTPEMEPIIFDFNISQPIGSVQKPMGTLKYISPEFLKNIQENNMSVYSPEIDVYSLGIIFYNMVFRSHPYTSIGTFNALKMAQIQIKKDTGKTFFKIIRETICVENQRANLKKISDYFFHFKENYLKEGILKQDYIYYIEEKQIKNVNDFDSLFDSCSVWSSTFLFFVIIFLFFVKENSN